MSAEYFQLHFKLSLIIEVNTINPDQTAPRSNQTATNKQSDLGPYCLQERLTKNISCLGNKQVLADFSLTVKVVTLIFISGHGPAISSAKQGKTGSIYNLVKN